MVRCIANIEEHELVHLSQKLNALECLQLVQAVYEITPTRMERKVKSRETSREDLSRMPITSKECLLNLEQWKHDFPSNELTNGINLDDHSITVEYFFRSNTFIKKYRVDYIATNVFNLVIFNF